MHEFLRQTYGHTVTVHTGRVTPEVMADFDLGVSYFYRHILRPEQFRAPRHGTVNYHIGALSAGTGHGAMPNVWALVERAPAGVTMHWIDEGVDTGPVIAQRRVPTLATDTGESLYRRLTAVCLDLFMETWGTFERKLHDGTLESFPQPLPPPCPVHRMADVAAIDDLEARFGPVARDVVDILRARTFTGHEAAWLRDGQGRKVYVRVQLEYAPE